MSLKFAQGARIAANSSTATGIITYADKRTVNYRWDHDTTQEWSATSRELADIARVLPTAGMKSELKTFLNAMFGRTAPAETAKPGVLYDVNTLYPAIYTPDETTAAEFVA